MPEYRRGPVLTCTHELCSCRVVIQAECRCDGVMDVSYYRCACGAPLVPIDEA